MRLRLGIISVLVVITLVGSFWTFRAYKKQRKMNIQVREMNSQIQKFSQSLQSVNEKLTAANSDLTEANAAKEEYIGLFVSLSSEYIDKMKKYQGNVRKLIISG